MKTHFFYKMKVKKVILKFQNHLYLRYIFCLTLYLLKSFQEYQHYEDTRPSYNNIDLSSYGHLLSLLYLQVQDECENQIHYYRHFFILIMI